MNLGWILNGRKIIWNIVFNWGTWLCVFDDTMELLSVFLSVVTILWLYSKIPNFLVIRKESDMTEQLNWTEIKKKKKYNVYGFEIV